MECELICKDWIILLIGFLFTLLWGVFIFKLKPQLIVKSPVVENQPKLHLKIPVENIGFFSNANDIKIEAAVVEVNFTYHFELDFKDYVMIPKKSFGDPEKIFKAIKPNEITQELYGLTMNALMEKARKPDNTLRIRIHANHSWTGLGKSFEFKFRYINNNFIKF